MRTKSFERKEVDWVSVRDGGRRTTKPGWCARVGEIASEERAGAIDRRTWRSSAEARTETARAARAGATPARSERVAARGAEVRETGVTRTATIVRAQGMPRAG
jgi:hypothetical protein